MPMMNSIRIVIWLLLMLSVGAVAHAQQRPLVTEDPETIGAERVLIEGGVSFDKSQTNSANGIKGDVTHIGLFGVSIGVGPISEVQVDGGLIQRLDVNQRVNAPLAGSTTLRVGDVASGLEDLIVATKLRVAAETPSRPAFGLRFGTKLPFASEDKGVGLGTTDFFATFLLAKTVQSVRTVGNVGLVVLGNPQGQDPATALGF